MSLVPAAIIQVNADLTDNVRDMLVRQLHINEYIDGYVFDDRIEANSEYAADVKRQDLRLMVIRPADETQNRDFVDVVIFVKAGLAAVEENKFGPHGITWKVVNLDWGKINIY